jgi:hypothetical protein
MILLSCIAALVELDIAEVVEIGIADVVEVGITVVAVVNNIQVITDIS